MARREEYIQIGVTALRDAATGNFLPATGLYIRSRDCSEGERTELAEAMGKLLAARIRSAEGTEAEFKDTS